jgi:hypothetical protein
MLRSGYDAGPPLVLDFANFTWFTTMRHPASDSAICWAARFSSQFETDTVSSTLQSVHSHPHLTLPDVDPWQKCFGCCL